MVVVVVVVVVVTRVNVCLVLRTALDEWAGLAGICMMKADVREASWSYITGCRASSRAKTKNEGENRIDTKGKKNAYVARVTLRHAIHFQL